MNGRICVGKCGCVVAWVCGCMQGVIVCVWCSLCVCNGRSVYVWVFGVVWVYVMVGVCG